MATTDAVDEFSFLAAQARERDAVVPPIARVEIALPDDRRLSALQWGTEPPEVTVLHGAGLNAHTWDATLLALDAPALAVDLAGHGDSTWRADADYAPARLAPDVIRLLEEFTDRPQILVGQSLGGLTAAVVAAGRPDLVKATVLVDITPGTSEGEGVDALRAFFLEVDFADRETMVERALAFGLGGNRADTLRGVTLNSRIRADGRAEWKHHIAHLFSQAAKSQAAGVVPEAGPHQPEAVWDAVLAAPRLTLVRGERGFVSDEEASALAERVPFARVITVESGHNVQEEIPDELADLIRDAGERADSGDPDG